MLKVEHYQQLVDIMRFLDRHTIWLANAHEGFTINGCDVVAYRTLVVKDHLKKLDVVTQRMTSIINEGIGELAEHYPQEEENVGDQSEPS